MNIVLIIISFVLGILSILYLRRYDIYDKEPISIMVATTFLGGFISIVITTLFYKLISLLGYNSIESIYGAFVFIGPIEEFSKLLALFATYFIFKDFMDEPVDGLIYCGCVVLGFSLIENYHYAVKHAELNYLIITRLFIATPVHLLFSIFMGLGFYKIKKEKADYNFLLGAFLYASIVHGLWDAFMFSKNFPLLPILILGFSFKSLIWFLEASSAKSQYRIRLKKFIETYENPTYDEALECIKCSDTEKKLTFRLGKIKICKCVKCGYYLSSMKSIFYIFQYFGSLFRNLNKYYLPPGSKVANYAVLLKYNLICERRKIAIFDLDLLSNYLEAIVNKLKLNDSKTELLAIDIGTTENYEMLMNSEDKLINQLYDPLDNLRTDNLQSRLEKYYAGQDELPDEINCPNCLSKIFIDNIKKSERSLTCPICEEKLDFQKKQTDLSNLKNYSIVRNKPKISFGQKMRAKNILYNINRYRKMRRLPSEIKCPICQNKILLSENERNERSVKCTSCDKSFNLTYKKILNTIK